MAFSFKPEDLKKINDTLGTKEKGGDDYWTWSLKNKETGQSVVFTVYNDVELDPSNGEKGVLVSVQTKHGYFELHGVTDYMVFDPDEVIFVKSLGDKVSCLVIGANSSCSLFSDLNKKIMERNITELDPAVLLSAMQLSLAEAIL